MFLTSSIGTKRPHRACLNCRRKKVRCYGERPACGFCARLGQQCIYPQHTPTMQPRFPLSQILPAQNHHYFPTFDIGDGQEVGEVLIEEDRISDRCRPNDMASNELGSFADHFHSNAFNRASFIPTTESNHDLGPTEGRARSTGLGGSPVLGNPLNKASQQLAVDTYFKCCHGQPYSMFHEETFRSGFSRSILPPYLILAIVASTLRYSHDPSYKDNLSSASNQFAAQAWRAILAECFESESGPDYRTVQGTILLAVHQFVGCNYRSAWIRIGMAISIAQSLNLMSEPPNLANSTREEHRRTLWSIYMLDRLGTCGTTRTGLFPDSALRLRLPCPENTFRDGSPNVSPTLKELNENPSDQLGYAGALARVILLASTLSRIASFSLQQSWQAQMEPPSTQNSEYAQLITRLNSLSTYFDKRQPFDPSSWSSGGREDSNDIALCIFSHILYHLCYCILQHPFVLKRRHRPDDAPFPGDFLSDSLQKNWQNAQDLTHTLSYATQKNMPTWSSFYAYCSLVAGTINCLHCLSTDENTQKMSELAVQMNFLFLERQAKLYANSVQMLAALRKFEKDAKELQHLVDPDDREHILDEDDVGRLYRLLDYSAQSTRATSEDVSQPGTELPLLSPSSLDALDLFDINFTSFDNLTPGMFAGESTQWNLD